MITRNETKRQRKLLTASWGFPRNSLVFILRSPFCSVFHITFHRGSTLPFRKQFHSVNSFFYYFVSSYTQFLNILFSLPPFYCMTTFQSACECIQLDSIQYAYLLLCNNLFMNFQSLFRANNGRMWIYFHFSFSLFQKKKNFLYSNKFFKFHWKMWCVHVYRRITHNWEIFSSI